jgi:GNAT superfamily N-acetyltransferase
VVVRDLAKVEARVRFPHPAPVSLLLFRQSNRRITRALHESKSTALEVDLASPRYEKNGFSVETDRSKLDVTAIHAYLTRSYWSEGIPRGIVEKAIANSLCFGLFRGAHQIGFARVVTDCATFAYLCDVYVLEEFRGQKLGVWLMECVMSHPELQGLRRFSLATRDAHGLYRKFGFDGLKKPESQMEIVNHDIYKQPDC